MSGSSKGWVFPAGGPRIMFGLARFVLAAAIAFSVTAALGQGRQVDYPNRPIKLIVAFPPGGATDVIARVVGQPLGQRLGQQVIVDNRSGSGTADRRRGRGQGETRRLYADDRDPTACSESIRISMPRCPSTSPRISCRSPTWWRTSSSSRSTRRTSPGQRPQELRRLRQACQATAVLCLDRQRQPAPSGDGNAQAAGRF